MSKFKPRLARMNLCCEQIMPVAVIPICAISCEIPRPIAEISMDPFYCPTPCYQIPSENQIQQQSQPQNQINTECRSCQTQSPQISNYYPGINVEVGRILTNTTGSLPNGYLVCDGSEISRVTYSVLFDEIGTQYGEGDGTNTFNLPNLIEPNTSNNYTYIIKI